jgi:hypothetical protein
MPPSALVEACRSIAYRLSNRKEAEMPFNVKEEMDKFFPSEPKPGEWWNVAQGLPRDYDEVLFIVEDDSAEGLVYYGYKEGSQFVVQYEFSKFAIGGRDGVAFWSPVPNHDKAFA